MKKYLFSLYIIVFALCLVGCEEKTQTMNDEPSTTLSTTTTSTTKTSSSTIASKEDDTTTTSKKKTSTTKKSTSTTSSATKTTLKSHRTRILRDEKGNITGYIDCDPYDNCKCLNTNKKERTCSAEEKKCFSDPMNCKLSITTTATPTTKRKNVFWKDEKGNTEYGYKYCDANNNCKCTLVDGTPREC